MSVQVSLEGFKIFLAKTRPKNLCSV